ncbi:12712_t:CDS:2, partial [Entrophospora sp. SA101]
KLNEVTERDEYPLPLINDIFDTMSGAKYFTTLDCMSGYWQMKVAKQDQPKTAYITEDGLYEFTVMPFGLSNAPASFQRMMDRVFKDYKGKFVNVYLDDITIYSQTFEEHLQHLQQVFDRLRAVDLKLGRDKCEFAKEELHLLGHIIGREGRKPDPAKVEAVQNWPTPKTVKDVRSFLGLASYYRKFIPNFSKEAGPMFHLIHKDTEFKWDEDLVVVKKKNGKLRLCVDYRKLNEVTERDEYPLPLINDIFDTMSGAKYFTTLDCMSGYWQMKVAKQDQPKTAYITEDGLYEFTVMPFGLSNAPASFQRMMDRVFKDYKGKFVNVYLDDITIYSQTFEEHLQHLQQVFDRLRAVDLKLGRDKCEFAKEELHLLGHIIGREGRKPDPAKVEAVQNWPTPKTVKDVWSFLGLASYYRKFIPNFSKEAGPMFHLIHKDTEFKWDED